MNQQKNSKWKLKDNKRLCEMISNDLQNGIWPIYNSKIKFWLES